MEAQELSLTGQMARPSLPDLYPFLTEEKICFSNQKSSRFTVKKSRNRKYAGKGERGKACPNSVKDNFPGKKKERKEKKEYLKT